MKKMFSSKTFHTFNCYSMAPTRKEWAAVDTEELDIKKRYEKAMLEAQDGDSSIRKASSTKWQLSQACLIRRLHERVPVDASHSRKTILSTVGEEDLVRWLKMMASMGFCISQMKLRLTAKAILDKSGHSSKLSLDHVKNLLSLKWYRCFMKRHAHLQLKLQTGLKLSVPG